jgi:hypothetical protein
MFNQFIVLDNAINDPDLLVEWAKNQCYYSSSSERLLGLKEIHDTNTPYGHWRGHRSQALHELDLALFEDTFDRLFYKIFSNYQLKFHYQVNAYMHFSPGYIQYDHYWWHTDPSAAMAGVIYLTSTPEPDSGTILRLDNDDYVIENRYNRLVMYNSEILHRPQRCFGTTVDNSRLTLTFFVNRLVLEFLPADYNDHT